MLHKSDSAISLYISNYDPITLTDGANSFGAICHISLTNCPHSFLCMFCNSLVENYDIFPKKGCIHVHKGTSPLFIVFGGPPKGGWVMWGGGVFLTPRTPLLDLPLPHTHIPIWPSTTTFDTATWTFLKIDTRHAHDMHVTGS